MSALLVDSNVLIDIVTENEVWTYRSRKALETLGRDRELVINSIVFAEVSIPFDRIEDIDERLPRAKFDTDDSADALAIAICHAHHRGALALRLRLPAA